MQFDIIDISDEELENLNSAQKKLLLTAQRTKDKLVYNAQKELQKFKNTVLTAGMKNSTLLDDKKAEIDAEVKYKCVILADDLIYNMSLKESGGGGGGGSGGNTGGYGPGYRVDYSLSYNERYIIVRDYYLQIKNVEVRMSLYSADAVAKDYLSSYYYTLYNVLATY